MKIANRVPSALVFHPLIRVKKIVADLRTEARFGLLLVAGELFGFAFLLLHSRDSRPQHFDRCGPVLVLAPFALTLHDNARWEVSHANGT